MRRINKANSDENEEKLTEIINSMYRTEILNKDFTSVEEYMKVWGEFQDKFLNETDSYKKYEVWCDFSKDKVVEKCGKIAKKGKMKEDLKVKQMENEVNTLKSKLELKDTDSGEKEALEKEIQNLRKENMAISQKEQDLKEEVIA